MDDYTFFAVWQEEGQNFAAKCSEYPSLNWVAETEEKAIEGIKYIIATIEDQLIPVLHAQ